jgi:hypothetical protein
MKQTLTLSCLFTICLTFILSVAVPSMAGAGPTAEDWVARYNNPGNSGDGANAIAIDSAGNVYVTGWSDGDGVSCNYATVKYDADGNERPGK